MVASVRSANIVIKEGTSELRIYANIQKTREQKDRARRLMKMGLRFEAYKALGGDRGGLQAHLQARDGQRGG